jgi:GxxExxY protein
MKALTYQVIGCAMHVHNRMGPGLKEAAYQRAPSLEFETAGLSFETEKPTEIATNDTVIGLLYVDHLVEGKLIVEEGGFAHADQ